MLTVPGSVRTDAGTETELAAGNEARPFVVLQGVAKRVAEYEAANCNSGQF
jgi:hypothetical protein